MSRKGRKFELEYKWLYELKKEKFIVESPGFIQDKITGRKREIDVLLRYKDVNDVERRIGIECRDRNHVEDVTWIEQLKTKKEDCELDCIIATTTKTLNENAIKKVANPLTMEPTADIVVFIIFPAPFPRRLIPHLIA